MVFGLSGTGVRLAAEKVFAFSGMRIYHGFATIKMRRFSADALGEAVRLDSIAPDLNRTFERSSSLQDLYRANLGLNGTLDLVSRFFPDLFRGIRSAFMEAFPFVNALEVRELTDVFPAASVPAMMRIVCIREGGEGKWIPITEMSSGMQKVLLIITDTLTMPDGGIYIIDEYENSLGMSAINFLPDFLLALENDLQLFMTSHHPYIINAIPPKNWYVFNRRGGTVHVKYGAELEARFGKSSQQAFVQLINDSFFTEGVE